MPDLLIHSVAEFSDLILEALTLAEARTIAEIGSEAGGMSALLADYSRARDGALTCIDPSPQPAFTQWLARHPEVCHLAVASLDALATMAAHDAWIVDGDHNWYTVYHELQSIKAACRRDGKPVLAFLHDVGWPCARRDQYYAPERIPAAYRLPCSFEGGVVPGDPSIVEGRGFRGNGQFALAQVEGGPRNGVMTAIDDFLREELAEGRAYGFAEIPAVFGLGVLFDTDAPWSEALADLLLPYHQNKLIRTLEHNRLRNYLRVIELQDQAARAG
ncbi:hypothetical protein RPB_1995 [Rhodopseudomonas palustris HaA2]|uniref:Class I SAM-dependent methyltransferase n=1 Tax=Rhodopseudomonas palustris (strain HaA2) TaxID=316058 RepID=Q2IYK7_RHOP2|nr:class I SAM-dependent methyltransferase [Rhodopseudomonas palustris]ABD06703.1 hypothetical protein RPB_1995 [Rhodopseudomonas palustris HaA2]